jgi:hypothetical protein
VRHGGQWDLICKNVNLIKSTTSHEIGIHAVYNLYNATCLTEFISWVKQQGLTIQWQSLYGPACLDPLRFGQPVKQMVQTELQTVLGRNDLTNSERDFLQVALINVTKDHEPIDLQQLRSHIDEIENQYHPDQQGKFAQLWPEISSLL